MDLPLLPTELQLNIFHQMEGKTLLKVVSQSSQLWPFRDELALNVLGRIGFNIVQKYKCYNILEEFAMLTPPQMQIESFEETQKHLSEIFRCALQKGLNDFVGMFLATHKLSMPDEAFLVNDNVDLTYVDIPLRKGNYEGTILVTRHISNVVSRNGTNDAYESYQFLLRNIIKTAARMGFNKIMVEVMEFYDLDYEGEWINEIFCRSLLRSFITGNIDVVADILYHCDHEVVDVEELELRALLESIAVDNHAVAAFFLERVDDHLYAVREAALNGSIGIVKLIMDRVPHVDLYRYCNDDGFTPLESVVRKTGNDEMIRFLLECGANLKVLKGQVSEEYYQELSLINQKYFH